MTPPYQLRHPGLALQHRLPGLDPGPILLFTSPKQRWIPDRAALVWNDAGC